MSDGLNKTECLIKRCLTRTWTVPRLQHCITQQRCSGSTHAPMNWLILSWFNSFSCKYGDKIRNDQLYCTTKRLCCDV